jgi:hypothetical protein
VRIRFHWGAGVALLYTVFALATVGFVIFAIANPAALVSDDYYREATRHDRRIEATANGRLAGADLVMTTDEAGAPVALLQVAPDHHGRGRGTITWYRPSDASFDRTIPLDVDARGVQRMPLADVPAGHWLVKVAWDVEGRPFYFERAVMVRR